MRESTTQGSNPCPQTFSKRRKNATNSTAVEYASSINMRKNNKVSYDDEGNPILPLVLGILTITNLGSIVCDRSTFHSKRYIWPVGFESYRTYASTINADKQTVYFSKIVDGGDAPRVKQYSAVYSLICSLKFIHRMSQIRFLALVHQLVLGPL